MKDLRRASCLSVVLLLGVAGPASANDSSFGGSGAALRPLEETRIQMVSERIVIELVDDSSVTELSHGADVGRAWRVHATYHFANPTDEEITLQMGFPESRCVEDWNDCVGRGGEFRNMRTTVRGARVRDRIGEVPMERADQHAQIGRVFLYDVTFAPGEEVEVIHQYTHDRSYSTYGEHLYYMTSTGRLWNGPIQRAEFIVRMPYVPRSMVASYPGTRHLIREGGVPVGISLRFRMAPFTPESDLEVVFFGWENEELTMGVLGDAQCPSVDRVVDGDPATLAVTDHGVLCGRAMAARWGGPVDEALREALATPDIELDQYLPIVPTPHPDFEPSWMPERARAYAEALAVAREVDEVEPASETETETRREPETPPSTPTAASASAGGCGCEAAPSVGSAIPPFGLAAFVLTLRRSRRRRRSA